MEERLKAHARRRREAAGQPPALHPVNRRLLHTEVERTYGRGERKDGQVEDRRPWFAWFWSRSGMVGGLCALVVLGGAIALVPGFFRTRSSPESAGVRERRDTGATTAPVAVGVPEPAKTDASVMLDKVSPPVPNPTQQEETLSARREGVAVAAAKPAPVSEPLTAAAPTPTPRGRPSESAASTVAPPAAALTAYDVVPVAGASAGGGGDAVRMKSVALSAGAQAPARSQSSSLSGESRGPQPAGAAGAQAVAGDGLAAAQGGQSEQAARFRQVDGYRRNFNSPPKGGILQTFRFEQRGRQVRIVDADNSVYAGEVVVPGATEEGQRAGGVAQETKAASSAAQAAGVVETQAIPGGAQAGGVQFRVAGTNRTLSQKVEFTGAYRGVGAAGGATPQITQRSLQFGAGVKQQQPQQQQTVTVGRIVGQVVVGNTNQVEIEAVTE